MNLSGWWPPSLRWSGKISLLLFAALIATSVVPFPGAALASATPPALQNITASPGDGFVEVQWAKPGNAETDFVGYAFRVSIDNASWYEPNYTTEPYTSKSVSSFEVRFDEIGNPPRNWQPYYIEMSPVLSSDTTLRNWQAPTGGPFTPQAPPTAPIVDSVTTPRGETLQVSWSIHPDDAPGSNSFRGDPNGITSFQIALIPDTGGIPAMMLLNDQNLWATPASPGAGTCVGNLVGTLTACDVEDLVAGTGYFVGVRAQNRAGFGDWGTIDVNGEAGRFVPTLSPPSAPSIGSVSVGDAEVTVTVSAGVSGGAAASLDVVASPGGETCTITGSSGSCTVQNLTNGTPYTFTATAVNATARSAQSAASTAVTPVLSPPGVPSVSGVSASDGEAQVTVASGSGGTPARYLVTSTPGGLTCTISHPQSSCNVTGLTNGTSYTFVAVAINSAGSSNSSSASSPVTPTLTAPGAPTVLSVRGGDQQATVSVGAGSGGAPASYLVTANPGGAQCSVTGPTGSCTVSNLDNGTAYTFSATATNSAGTSASSSSSSPVTPAVPVAPPRQTGVSSGDTNPRRALPTVLEIALGSALPRPNILSPGSASPRALDNQIGGDSSGQTLLQALTPSGRGQSAVTLGPAATIGGQIVSVESSVRSPTQLSLQVGTVSLGVSVAGSAGTVGDGMGSNGSGPVGIQLANGAATTFEGGGLTPGSAVHVVLPLSGDNSVVLAVLKVAEDGTFTGDASFGTTPEGDPLPIGVRVVQLFTVDEAGNDVVVEVAVTIGQADPTPAINRVDGSVPALIPGGALGTSAGLPQVIEVRAIEEQKLAVIDGGDWSMAVDVASSTGVVQSIGSGAQLTLVRDESAMVSGSGFMAGTRADVWLFSEPTLLGTVTVDENGDFVGEVTIDGVVIPAGEHTLQLQGVGQDGYVKATSLGVAVADVTPSAPGVSESSNALRLVLAIGGVATLMVVVFFLAASRLMRKQ